MAEVQFASLPEQVPFKKALRVLIGGRYMADRMHLFRKFREYEFALFERERKQFPERFKFHRYHATPQEELADLRKRGVPKLALSIWLTTFPEWRKRNRHEVNQQNAQTRWSKKKKLARTSKAKK